MASASVIFLANMTTVEAQQLRQHCLCGDELAWRGVGWSEPLGAVIEEAGRGEQPLAFRYRFANGEDWRIEFGRFRPDVIEEILGIVRVLPLAAADRRWRTLAARLGPVPSIDGTIRKVINLSGREIVAARRAVHPCHIIDRLMMRDRATVMAEVETLLFGCRPALDTLRCA